MVGVLRLIDENKVDIFNNQLCISLLDGSTTVEDELEKVARLSQDSNAEEAIQTLLKTLQICNSNVSFDKILDAHQQQYSDKLLAPFEKKNLELKLEQQIFMSLCQNQKKVLLCTGAGVGKTTFLGGLVLSTALNTDEPIIIINANKRLLNRDFEDMLDWSYMVHEIKSLDINLYSESKAIGTITFMTPQELKQAVLPHKYHIVIDELQLILTREIVSIVQLFEQALTLVGVTGSPMPLNYRTLLQILLPNACVANFPDEYKFNTIEKDAIFVSTIHQQCKQIDKIYSKQREVAPLLCIMDKELIIQYKKHDLTRQWVTFMDELNDQEFNLVLKQQFTKLRNGFYGCYVVTEIEGVGIEYPSTPQIDKAGGVAVCICVQPESYSDLAQFKRRTGRIGRPGVIYFVFEGKKDVGRQNYMRFLEKKLLKKEEKAVRELKSFLKNALERNAMESDDDESMREVDDEERTGNEEIEQSISKKQKKNKYEVKPKNSSTQLENEFNEQLHIQDNEDAEMKDLEIIQIDTSSKLNEEKIEQINTSTKYNNKTSKSQKKNIMKEDSDKEDWPLNSDEEVAQFCDKCGKSQQNCLCKKDTERVLQWQERMDKFLKNSIQEKIKDKFKLKIADNSMEAQERRKAKEQYEAEVNSLIQVIKQKLQAESQEDFNSKLCKIYSIPTISHLPQRLCRMYGSKDTNLQACQDFLKQYDQSIVNKKETNQIQQYPVSGKKTNKRVAAPLTDDDNSATQRTSSKTMEASNIYQELKEQGKKKKFITGPANTLGFKDKVAQNKRTQKNIEKNQNISKGN